MQSVLLFFFLYSAFHSSERGVSEHKLTAGLQQAHRLTAYSLSTGLQLEYRLTVRLSAYSLTTEIRIIGFLVTVPSHGVTVTHVTLSVDSDLS